MKDILRISLPICFWLVGFSAVYALQGLTCSRHWPDYLDARSVLVIAWAIAILVQVLSLAAILYLPSMSRFLQKTATIIAVAALIAAVWTSLPVLAGATCV